MKKQRLILLGGGGHCKACIDVIEQLNQYEIVGILDHSDLVGSTVLGYKIIGTDDDIIKYIEQSCLFLITVGQIKSAFIRKKLFQLLKDNNAQVATIISSKAYVSGYAQIGAGTIVMHGAFINAEARIGDNCILNTGCDIEHDVIIGNHTHISTSSVINGDCHIGDEVFVGSNATISSQTNIGNNIVIGTGSVVIKNINKPGIYAGNPANLINR